MHKWGLLDTGGCPAGLPFIGTIAGNLIKTLILVGSPLYNLV